MQRSTSAAAGAKRRREALRRLPAVSRLLAGNPVARLARRYGTELTTALLREALAALREEILAGTLVGPGLGRAVSPAAISRRVGRAAEELLAPRPRRVVNATGVVLHTNLGRAPLSAEAAQGVAEMARGYVDLEYDVASGRRGSRLDHLAPLMERLFPGRGFVAVNNNAAAILLCLRALSRGKEALVARGELVEIGGSFRVPDILAASGARLREVGTTNRTRAGDFAAALTSRSGMILKVHTSNFRIVGFTEAPTIEALARVAAKAGLPLVVDWGSGDLVDLGPLGIHDELPVNAILEAGADLVTFSGDKLLGGPQAGMVVGRPELVAKLRRDPMARVCRLDRLLLAALQRTLAAYVSGRAFEEVPTLRMLACTEEETGRRATRLRREVARSTGQGQLLSIVDGISRTGGGSSPGGERKTRLLRVALPAGDAGPLEARLRTGDPPIVGRIREGALLLDLRTVLPDQDALLAQRLAAAIAAELKR